jgi:hypothetical protein
MCPEKTPQIKYNGFFFWLIMVYFGSVMKVDCRSQWPRGLRCMSAAARLLRWWGAWMSVVSVVCCQVEVSATSLSLIQRSPTNCGASLCVI